MDLQNDYEKLYQHWLEEFNQADLTELNVELFNHYKTILNTVNDYHEEKKGVLKNLILQSYKENINFLFNDFLKIREIKIISSALALKEINLTNIIEAEKLLYQNIISSIKGYKKVKGLSLYEGEDESKLKDVIDSEIEPKRSIIEDSLSNKDEELIIADLKVVSDEEKFKYILIRFLKKTPPLVGVDLRDYGPFEIEDIANLPQKNAKILIIEKFAEKIEIP